MPAASNTGKAILHIPDLIQTSESHSSSSGLEEASLVDDQERDTSSSSKDASDITRLLPKMATLNLEGPGLHDSNLKTLTLKGKMHLKAYKLFGSTEDLNNAIFALKGVIDLSKNDDPGMLDHLSDYSIALGQLFDRSQDTSHLNNAIDSIQIALNLSPEDHPNKPEYYNFLSTALRKRSRLTEDPSSSDLDNAITNARKAIADISAPHNKQLPIFFNSLGTTLLDRFSQSRKTEDITEAIKNLIRAADLSEGSSFLGRYHRAGLYKDLGNAYLARFELTDQLKDLERAIRHHRHAVTICSNVVGHRISLQEVQRQAQVLFALAGSLRHHFTRLGRIEILGEAISILRVLVDQPKTSLTRAKSLKPHPAWLAMLGALLSTRYNTSGSLHDLENAIQYQRDSLNPDSEAPNSKLALSGFMIGLATSLRRHFNITKNVDELEEAVMLEKKAILSIPADHPKAIIFRGNLSRSLLQRYSIFGELSDLQTAITFATEALTAISAEYSTRASYLQILGNALVKRYDHLGNDIDVDKAIQVQYLAQSVANLPENHPSNPGYLHDLGIAFNTRSKISKSKEDADNAVLYFRKALSPLVEPRLSKVSFLNALGLALVTRYELFHQEEDILESISLFREAINLSHRHVWLKVDILRNLGGAFRLRYERRHQDGDIAESISVLTESATLEGGNPRSRILSAISWFKSVRLHGEGHPRLASSLDMYKIAMDLLPYLSYIGASIQSRYHKLLPSSKFVCNAIAAALSVDCLELAMEWVEQGCSIVWRQASQLRSSEYDSLRTTHPEHADRIQELADKLGKGLQISSEIPHLDCSPQEYSKLAVEYDECLAEVRALNGYERFLLPKRFSELRGAAAWGPVVVLNASEYGCDALILASPSSTLHRIHFPDITKRVLALRKLVQGTLSELELTPEEDNDWEHVRILDMNVPLHLVLRELCNLVVKPCVEYLQSVDIPNMKKPVHIHWCPLGLFASLPIHAAGTYEPDGSSSKSLSEYVVSSYTPTISSLLRPISRRNDGSEQQSSTNYKLLVIGSDASLSSTPTSNAQQRIECIQTQAKASGLADSVVILEEPSNSTPSKILSQMTEYSSVHFACPIERHPTDPSQSALVLPNGMLRIQDLVFANQSGTPRKLAFFTSGGSAHGDERLPGESIHFAAGMLHIGYEHVIATMWDVPVEDKLFVVGEVYKRLFASGGGGMFLSGDADVGMVLDEVLKELRGREEEGRLGSWVSFLHFGR